MTPVACMQAGVLHGKEAVRVEAVPIPAVGAGEVRVRVRAALTCGTDVKVFRRGYHARMIVPPAVFGHEFAGEIEAVGAGVTEWTSGTRVTAGNSAPCDACFHCERGQPELCEYLLFVNGAYAEYLTLPARLVQKNLLRIPAALSFEEAALVEPLACVVHGMAATPVRPGDLVTVLGTGSIGLLFVRLCVLAGARVIAVGRRESRLRLAAELGAEVTLNAAEDAAIVETVQKMAHGGRGADTVIECVGMPQAWEQAIAMVRKGGLVHLFGGCPKETLVRLDTARIHYDQLTLVGTFHHTPKTVREALRLIASGAVPARSFIQQHAPLSDLPAILQGLADGTNPAVKIALHPDESDF